MICYITGRLAEKTPARAVVEAGGIGYELHIPLSSYDRLPEPGQDVTLQTHHYVREDSHQLFGFSTPAEKDFFERMLSVSGIGPRLALSVLSGLSVREIKAAVVEHDVKRLSSISGIGKKTAERLIMELRDKLDQGEVLEVAAGGEGEPDARLRDTVLALISLGYKQGDAQKMVKDMIGSMVPDDTVEDLVRKALTG